MKPLWRTWLAGKRLPDHFGKAGVQGLLGDAQGIDRRGVRDQCLAGPRRSAPNPKTITGFYPDRNSPGKIPENRTLKAGSSTPRAEEEIGRAAVFATF